MEQLIVLDFSDSSVHFYKIDSNYEPDDVEELISDLGHHPSSCSWMFGQNVRIEFHGDVINADSRTR